MGRRGRFAVNAQQGLWVVVLVSLTDLQIATANETESAARSSGQAGQWGAAIEEIVVYAQKRAESLGTVPVSVTAVTGERLAAKGFGRSDDIARLAPNVTFAAGNFDATPKVYIRGIGSNEFVQNANTGVGIYVDEVFKGLATGQTFQLFDLERVEVLRGPQSTLYGKNTSGGAINFYTAKPEPEFGSGVDVSYGRFDAIRADGYLNAPLTDSIMTRWSVATRKRDGLFENTFTGEEEGRRDNWAARGQLRYEPGDRFGLNFKLEASGSDTDFKNARHVGVYDPAAVGDPSRLGTIIDPVSGDFVDGFDLNNSGVDFIGYSNNAASLTGASDYPMSEDIDTFGASLKLELALERADFVSISAYELVDRAAIQDADYSPNAVFHNDWFNESTLFSQEIRLSGEAGRLQWLTGIYYYEDEHDVGLDLTFFECFSDPVDPCVSIIPGLVLPTTEIDYDYVQKTDSYAFFTQEALALTDRLTLTAGIRYTREEREIDAASVSSVPAVVPGFPRFSGSETWNELSGKIGLDYQWNDNLFLYGSFSQGFKAGNWNGGAYNFIQQIDEPADPETVDTIEIGAKTSWLEDRLRANVAAFHSQVDDLQVFVFQSRVPVLQNAAEGEISGVELELAYLPVESLRLDLAYGYLDATYENFVADVTDPTDISGSTFLQQDLSGNRVVQTPEHSVSAALSFEHPVSAEWNLLLGADYSYRSKVYFTVFNDYLQQDGVGIANLRAGLANRDSGWSVTAFVNNLGDERYFNDAAQIGLPFGMDELFEAYDVRLYGLRVSARF